MDPNHLAVGDAVKDSPVGPGHITGITDAGYPQVNHVAVARLTRTDGIVFDPHGTYARDAERNAKMVSETNAEVYPTQELLTSEDFLKIILSHQDLAGRIALTFDTDVGTKLTSVAKTLLKACNRHLAYKP